MPQQGKPLALLQQKPDLSNEANQTLSLSVLNQVAKALNCQLCYSLVPNKNLEVIVRDQAEQKARRYLKTVGHSMALESQELNPEGLDLIRRHHRTTVG